MRRTSAALAGAVAAVLALAGCSDDEPAAEPTNEPSASTTASPSPTSTAPTQPPEAAVTDAAGAEAFARFWFDLVNYAYATGDTAPLQQYATPDCANCTDTKAEIDTLIGSGGSFEGFLITVDSAVATAPDSRGSIVTTVFDEAPSRRLSADGQVQLESPGATDVAVDLLASSTSEGWRVFGVGLAGQ